jgi:hypothetical protein
MQVEPASSGVFAILFYGDQRLHAGGRNPDGSFSKILWLIDPKKGDAWLNLTAQQLGATNRFQLRASRFAPGDGTPIEDFFEYGQGLVFPSQGCWRVDLQSGTAAGSLTFWVEPAVKPSP